MNGPSSMIAACIEPQPTSWLLAIKRFPSRRARPCVSPTVKTGFLVDIIGLPLGFGPKHTPPHCMDQVLHGHDPVHPSALFAISPLDLELRFGAILRSMPMRFRFF